MCLKQVSLWIVERGMPNIAYSYQFGYTSYILKTIVYLNKIYAKTQKCILLGYYERSKAYRVCDNETLRVEESIHARFDEKEPYNDN